MRKIFWLHIIFCCFSFTTHASNFISIEDSILNIDKDSLQIDTTNVTPRQFQDLKEKYSEEEFIYERTVEKAGWWTRFKQWLKDFLRIKTSNGVSNTADIALQIFYVAIFLLVIFFIVKAVINKEGTWVFGKSSDKSIIPVIDLENDIHVSDFKALIAKAESTNNYRLAVRYYYLWILKALTSAEIIEYDVEKTNSDYQNEITSKTMKDNFSYASYLYNYIWYGEFDVNDEEFITAKHAFDNFIKSIEA